MKLSIERRRDMDRESGIQELQDSLPPGRFGQITEHDLEATRRKIRGLLPAPPMLCWRY